MDVKVRPLRPSDKEPLMSFIKDVWGGHDYIPSVWDDWVGDPRGKMFVVEVDGTPVGMNRLRFLEDGSAWFEGVRVHPDFRGKGLATMLGENSMKLARNKGVETFRLTSSSTNHSAHRQVTRMGFRESARFSVYETSKEMQLSPRREVGLATKEDLAKAMLVAQGSPEYKLGTGVIWDGFTAARLTSEGMDSDIAAKSVYLTEGAVAVARPAKEGKNRWNQVCFVGGDPQECSHLIEHIFAARGKADWKLAYIPQGSAVIPAVRKRGLRRSYSMILFERRATNG